MAAEQSEAVLAGIAQSGQGMGCGFDGVGDVLLGGLRLDVRRLTSLVAQLMAHIRDLSVRGYDHGDEFSAHAAVRFELLELLAQTGTLLLQLLIIAHTHH